MAIDSLLERAGGSSVYMETTDFKCGQVERNLIFQYKLLKFNGVKM
jgi:hypothetical protein